MANLNFVSQSNSDHSITGDGSLISPLNGYRYSYGGSQTINYSAGVSGTIYFDFTLQDMMSSGAMGYVTVNGSYLGGATLYSPGTSLSGTSSINSGDTLVIYFDPGSDTSHMAYFIINSIYIVSSGTTTTTTTLAPNIIKPKRSYTLGNTPTLSASEIAINAASPAKIWIGSEDGMSNVLVGSMSLADMTGTAATATNLAGGNNTTLLGSIPYQSASNTTTLLSPNTTTTKKFLRETGNGTNGAAPAWDTVLKSDVGLGSVENTALSTWAGTTNITTVGAVTTRTLAVTPVASTGTQSPSVTVTAPAHTTLTASTEYSDVYLNLARTAQFATGALTTQRAVRISAPTYSSVAASTITTAVTLSIEGPPNAGSNVTITNPVALNVGTSNGIGIIISGVQNQSNDLFRANVTGLDSTTFISTTRPALTIASSGALVLNPTNSSAGSTNQLRFLELAANGTNYVGFKAGDNIASNVIWTLPTTDGANGGTIITNGSSTLSWSTAPSAASNVFLANNFGGL